MNKLLILSRLLLLFTILGFSKFSYGQIIINSGPEVTPTDMVENFVGDGILYYNVTFQGADVSRGIFTNGDSTNLGIKSGIFLTSGAGYVIPGPNTSSSAGENNGLGGHPSLNNITTSTTYDAAVLEFDFYPESDTLRFKYVFGSEEYNEYVNGTFNDVFGFFVTGPNPMGSYYNDKNMAIVPGTTNINISINNVNNGWAAAGTIPTGPCTNCQYYSDNTNGLTLQYDGLTTVLYAWLVVIPCAEYHLTIGVADAGDHIYDTGVFLEENSITCPKIDIETHLNPPNFGNSMIEEVVDADVVFKLPNPDYAPLTVNFELGGTADPSTFPPGDFEESIPIEISFEEGEDSASINIRPVYDAIMEGEETLQLIVENTLGCMDRYDTIAFNILDYLEMYSQTSPDIMICYGQAIDLWVEVFNGFPPYSYLWEPGGYTNDSITVSPEETGYYKVTYSDIFTSKSDSIMVVVIPLDYEVFSFSFQAEDNPVLFTDVVGEIFEDSISLDVPYGTNLNNLVATFSLSDGAWAIVNGEDQISGVSANDFTNQVTYKVIAPGGCMKDWMVNVNLVTGQSENQINTISIYPNPAKDKISISNAKGNKLTVLNSLGTVVLERYIDKKKLILDVADFVEGVYYLQFNNDQQWFVEKVIINK